jgi:hypothetical protein
MGSSLEPAVVRSVLLPITESDEARLELLKSRAELSEALNQLIEVPLPAGPVSESALIHAVIEAGFGAARSLADEIAYAMIAVTPGETASQRQAEARRRQPSWVEDD